MDIEDHTYMFQAKLDDGEFPHENIEICHQDYNEIKYIIWHSNMYITMATTDNTNLSFCIIHLVCPNNM